MSRTQLHAKVDIHHRTGGGGTFIARYRIRDANGSHSRYLEGYGRTIGAALEQLSKVIRSHPDAVGRRYDA